MQVEETCRRLWQIFFPHLPEEHGTALVRDLLQQHQILKNEGENLTVKQLAASLGVSTRYVYEMRRCGFQMHGRGYHNQTATHANAIRWIEENSFIVIGGNGQVQKDPNSDR